MFILSLSSCGPSAFLKTLLFIEKLVDILKFLVPIGIIVIISIDFFKSVIASNENDMKKNLNLAIKRLIYATFLFLVPTIVEAAILLLGTNGIDFATCYGNITKEEIALLEKEEKAEMESLYKYNTVSKSNYAQNARRIISDSNINNGDSNAEGCDGVVYYENGVFYKPESNEYNGKEKSKGSAKYGYNKYFFELLKKMTSDAEANGYSVKYSTTTSGAWRSYEKQQDFYKAYKAGTGNLAAVPGTSKHGWGIASDLKYYSTKKHSRQESINWAHENAGKYGLAFPVSSENWHIEPSEIKTDDKKVKKCL